MSLASLKLLFPSQCLYSFPFHNASLMMQQIELRVIHIWKQPITNRIEKKTSTFFLTVFFLLCWTTELSGGSRSYCRQIRKNQMQNENGLTSLVSQQSNSEIFLAILSSSFCINNSFFKLFQNPSIVTSFWFWNRFYFFNPILLGK